PGLECIQMTPICPHSLCSRTMIFSPDKRLELRLTTRDAENMYICSDGKISEGISAEDRIIISRSERYLRLIDISGSTFYNSVNRKLMSPIKGI
ncbi:MAG: NAD(+)/NADH kinase, partial [Huintestinicola sp.]